MLNSAENMGVDSVCPAIIGSHKLYTCPVIPGTHKIVIGPLDILL